MPKTIKPIKAPGNGFVPFALALCFLTGCAGAASSRKVVLPPAKLSDYRPPNAFSERNRITGKCSKKRKFGCAIRREDAG